jgi:hypothetical protein
LEKESLIINSNNSILERLEFIINRHKNFKNNFNEDITFLKFSLEEEINLFKEFDNFSRSRLFQEYSKSKNRNELNKILIKEEFIENSITKIVNDIYEKLSLYYKNILLIYFEDEDTIIKYITKKVNSDLIIYFSTWNKTIISQIIN